MHPQTQGVIHHAQTTQKLGVSLDCLQQGCFLLQIWDSNDLVRKIQVLQYNAWTGADPPIFSGTLLIIDHIRLQCVWESIVHHHQLNPPATQLHFIRTKETAKQAVAIGGEVLFIARKALQQGFHLQTFHSFQDQQTILRDPKQASTPWRFFWAIPPEKNQNRQSSPY